jgi:hypothetical protein
VDAQSQGLFQFGVVSGDALVHRGMMAVREIQLGKLSPDYPWFVQQQIIGATHDVTVVYVNGRCFALRPIAANSAKSIAGHRQSPEMHNGSGVNYPR